MYEIHAQYNWMFPLHMLFFHVISIYLYGLTPGRNKGMHDGENISFDASLVIYVYINSTSIPPIMIMNRMYENQNLLYIVPLIRHTTVECMPLFRAGVRP
jgi:hypothetical protein